MTKQRSTHSLCWLAGLALSLVAPNAHAQVGSWALEDGAGQVVSDFSGPHHGVLGATTAVESTDPTWTTTGFVGGALQFDGDDLVTIPDDSALQLSNDMTIWASFYIDSFNGDWVRVVGKGNPTDRNYGLWYNPNGTALFQIYGTTNGNAQVNLPINPGQWYTMVGVKDGTSMRLYVDGIQVASGTMTGIPGTSADPVTIGKAPIHTGHVGRIDQVRIYDRALSEGEILGIGTSYCLAGANSVGGGANLTAIGSDSVSANDLVLTSTLVPNQPGLFFYGSTQVQIPFGHGYLCVQGQMNFLYPPIVAVANVATFAIDYPSLPSGGQITAGSTWNFQHWYRDPVAGGPAFNASDALSITFTP